MLGYNALMHARSVLLPLALLAIAASAPSADLKWRRITIDRSIKGKWDARTVVLEATPGNALTRAAARGMRTHALSRMTEFIDRARSESAGSNPNRSYAFDETPRVSISKPDLISIVVSSYSYEGGAHPYTYDVCENWASVGGAPRKLALADLLVRGAKDVPEVSMLVIGKLRDMPDAMWVQEGEVKELTKDTRDSFTITAGGLRFLFAPYVMGPYVVGEITVDLSWSELKGLVNPAGPLKPVMR